jgi:hypothetical protein
VPAAVTPTPQVAHSRAVLQLQSIQGSTLRVITACVCLSYWVITCIVDVESSCAMTVCSQAPRVSGALQCKASDCSERSHTNQATLVEKLHGTNSQLNTTICCFLTLYCSLSWMDAYVVSCNCRTGTRGNRVSSETQSYQLRNENIDSECSEGLRGSSALSGQQLLDLIPEPLFATPTPGIT